MSIEKAMKDNGFFLWNGLFSEESIKIKNDVCNVFNCDESNINEVIIQTFKTDFDRFHKLATYCQQLISVYSLTCSDKMTNSLRELGIKTPIINTKPLISFSCVSVAKEEKYWKVSAHQDWPSTKGTPNGLTCWIPLVSLEKEDLGPLQVFPCSHLRGLRDHKNNHTMVEEFSDENFVPIYMDMGDALFFNYYTIHRSGTNSHRDKIRISIHLRYDDVALLK